jgi:hypothetical protein
MIFGEPIPTKCDDSVKVYPSLIEYFDKSNSIKELLQKRRVFGIEKYGTELTTHNNRNMKKDFVEEMLDGLVYLEGIILEEGDDFFLRNTKLILGMVVEKMLTRMENNNDQ